jgi:tetratricopeptide (TPR) repeat protein
MTSPRTQPPVSFDLADQEEIGALFAEAMTAAGLDGARIFAALAAGKSMSEALALPDGAVDFIYSRAHQWFAIGRADRAEPLFRTLCLLTGQADHFVGYGLCLAQRKALDAAASALNCALRLRPGWALPHLRLAEVALRQGDRDEARRAFAGYEAARLADGGADPLDAEAARLKRLLEFGVGSAGGEAWP